MKRVLLVLAGLFVVVVAGLVILWFAVAGPGPVPPATVSFTSLAPDERAALARRGEYVARAADCMACHMSTEQTELAGGLPFETPVGTFYGTNISSSRRHGIGDWTADDLYRSLVWGIGDEGEHLYPSMPYTAYHGMTRADVDALWVYLMQTRPIEKPNIPHDLAFPFNIRPLIAFWNLLYRPDDRPGAMARVGDRGDGWHRGRYLVDVLGHCGECHTPRNLAFATTGPHLSGEVLEGALAPDIRPEGLIARGWNPQDLALFLKTGLSPQGTPSFRMYSVLDHSTRYLDPSDIGAMVHYLFDGRDEVDTAPPAAISADRSGGAEGHRLYLGLCAGCHGSGGEGRPFAAVPLQGNTTLMFDNPRNLIRVIDEGIPARRLGGMMRMQTMPAFGDMLSADQMAALVNHLRERWGGRGAGVTAGDVSDVIEAED